MIKSISINYNNNIAPHGFQYIMEDRNTGEKNHFLPEKIEFTDGLNILVGTNGCGKTTVLNLLTNGCLVYGLETNYNFWDSVAFFYPQANQLGDEKYKEIQNIVSIENNYNCPVKRMDNLATRKKRSGDQFSNITDFAQFFNEKNMSKGQKMMNTLMSEIIRAQKDFQNYRYSNLFLPKNSANDTWMKGSDMVKSYIEKTNCPDLLRKSTFLMDEPDDGLDVFNLKELKEFLITSSETCQLIVVLHNPLLIKSLADKANIIEMTPNYMNAINSF